MNGFINVLKPPGMSSAAVVAVVKRLTNENRVGHAGTLDPEASGVLPVMVGRASRLFDYLVEKEKTYVAECAFGVATDTQDATGKIVAAGDNYPSREAIEAAAKQLTGDIRQRPGMYSAIKLDGKPMYQRARKGEEAEVPERIVHVERIALGEEMSDHGIMLRVDCGRGTYIRSICEDLGKLTGCPAHMRFLLRAKTGAFDLSTAHTVEELQKAADEGTLAGLLLPMDMPVQHLPKIDVPAGWAKQVDNGVKLPASLFDENAEDGKPTRVYLNDIFRGIAVREDGFYVWRAQFPKEG